MKWITFLITMVMAGLAQAADRVICRLAPGAFPYAVARTNGLAVLDYAPGAPFAYFEAPAGLPHATVLARLNADNRVVWAEDEAGVGISEPEGKTKITHKGSTLPAVGDRVTLQGLNSDALGLISWDRTLAWAQGRAVRVAILDTGLSVRQRYLAAKVDAWLNLVEPGVWPHDIPRRTDSNGDGVMDSKTGHGTMVAGVVDQISPRSRFVVVRVADSDGQATAWRLIRGLVFAVRSGAEVANVSLGSSERIAAMSDVLDWVSDNGLLVVAAAGNANAKREFFPAAYSSTLGVGGLNPNGTKAGFSNYERSLEASGPAVRIVSQDWDGSVSAWSGTSFSTPMATAIAAEVVRRLPGRASPRNVRRAFQTHGDDLDAANPAYRTQLGKMLNFARIVGSTKSALP